MMLDQRVAMITGGASGIGLATAGVFCREGAKVVIADKNEAGGRAAVENLSSQGFRADFVALDVTSENSVKEAVSMILGKHGSLSVLCNSAGITAVGSVVSCSLEVWESVMAVNVRGTFLCCKHAIPAMVDSGGGAIVNLASIASFAGFKDRAAYCASKGAVLQLTRQIAIELAKDNIRVNAVAPATVKTDLLKRAMPDPDEREEAIRGYIEQIPMQRLATVEDVAEAVLWLASDRSSFVTGAAIVVDGGWLTL